MREPSLEALFERYRAAGDLAAMAEVFDRSAPELLALAAHLVRDPIEAEDLVQATFLAAIEGARAFDASRRLAPWLAGILVRQALRVQRQRARRVDPAQLERPPVAEPPVLLEQRELAAALEGALDGLDEPYRSVLARHLGGERALDIARSSGRAPGTVRMQILRGLERLRRVLPAGLFALAPVRIPRGLEAVRAEVLRQGGVASATGSAASAGWIGGLTMSLKTVLVVCAAAVLGLVLFVRARQAAGHASVPVANAALDPERPLVPIAEPAPAIVEPARMQLAASESETSSTLPPPGSSATSEPAGVWVVGQILGIEAEPEATAILAFTENGLLAKGTGSKDGTYAIEVGGIVGAAEPATLHVTAAHPSGRRAQAEIPLSDAVRASKSDERTELMLDFVLSASTAVVGRVAGEGLAFAELQLGLVPEEGRFSAFGAQGGCDEQGRFALHPARPGRFRLIAACPGVLPLALDVEAQDGVATDVGTLRLDRRGVAIEGRLVAPIEPLASAAHDFRVRARRVFPRDSTRHELFESVCLRAEGIEVAEGIGGIRTDGTFRIEGLDPGTYTLELERGQSRYLVPSYPALEVAAPASGLVFGQEYGILRVTVKGIAPGGSAFVMISIKGVTTSQGESTGGDPLDLIVDRRASLTLNLSGPDGEGTQQESPPRSREVVDEIALELPTDEHEAVLEFTWSVAEGSCTPEYVRAVWESSASMHDKTVKASPGGCRFTKLLPGRHVLTLEARSSEWGVSDGDLCVAPIQVEVLAGRTVHVAVTWERSGRVRFLPNTGGRALESARARVLDALGVEQPVRFTRRELRNGSYVTYWGGSLPLLTPCELEPSLPAGSYTLVLFEKLAESLRVPFVIVAGETVDVPFVVP